MAFKRKIFNDPLYGFITIPDELTFSLIEHPMFQRLRRISQLGLTSMVYPGALHTRFQHALGAMHLMTQAIETLKIKGVNITDHETQGAIIAILLHDIGHGPFSHALENCIVQDLGHEEISKYFISHLNQEFNNSLKTAIEVFNNTYPVPFLHQLVSGQLDMDRMDYLMRDSFYTGVSEGVINTDRILKMITIAGDSLAVEAKGIYSIEKFIVARRLMYWQVYFHKTVLSAEYMLVNVLKRAKFLANTGEKLFASPNFAYFLDNQFTKFNFMDKSETLEVFAELDDAEIMTSIKNWVNHPDVVLSTISKSLIERRLFRVIISNTPFEESYLESIRQKIVFKLNIPQSEAEYLLTIGTISNNAYDPLSHKINIVDKAGVIRDISEFSDQLNISVYSGTVERHFVCFPKWAE
ncbi:MAG: HD domain-containing protein [Bacteroidetes bacterium]|nr:HD domain-containing protein [Bacteroidota bacterium]